MNAPRTGTPPRARRWLWRGLALVLVAALLSVLALAWLLRSGGGRDFALARVLAALPPDSLSWQRAEGTIAGPLRLYGVRYEHEGLRFEAARVLVDLAPVALLGRTLQVERLEIENGVLDLPPGEAEPEPWPEAFTLPGELPSLQMPLALALDALAIRDLRIAQGEVALVELDRVDAIGRLERGRIALQRLEVESDRGRLVASGALDSASAWDTGLQASVELAGIGEEPLPLTIEADGDLGNLTLVATARLPEPARATLQLREGWPRPRWTLALSAPRIEPARLGIEAGLRALELEAEGDLDHVVLSGTAQIDDRRIQLLRSTLRYADGAVQLDPLALDLAPGAIDARGRIDLRGDAPRVALELGWSELELPGGTPDTTVRSEGTARVDGPLADYVLESDATLVRGAERAALTLRGRGDAEHLALERLELRMPQGSLDASGDVYWQPHPRWDLRARLVDFDPGWLRPDFPGAVDADFVTAGEIVEGEPRATLTLDPLGGTLRGRALAGRIDARVEPGRQGAATLDLRIGDSRLRGRGQWRQRIEATLDLAPLQLQDLLPGASGRLAGSLVVGGTPERPTLVADIDGEGLAYGEHGARRLRLRSRTDGVEAGEITIDADELRLGGQEFRSLQLVVNGRREAHRLDLALDGELAQLALKLAGGERDGTWRGTLEQLRIVPRERETWRLDRPPALVVDTRAQTLQLDPACLRSGDASVCTSIAWQQAQGEASFELDSLPLATLDPFIGAAFDVPVSAYGEVSASASLRRGTGGAVAGEIELRSERGGLRFDPESPRDLLVFEQLELDGRFDEARAEFGLAARLGADGELRASLVNERPLAPDGELQGQVELQLRELAFLELFSDQVADARGRVDARLAIGGTRDAPALDGEAMLQDFGAEIPSLDITLREGRATLRSDGASGARLEAALRSGEGELRVEGRYDAAAEAATRLELTIRGEKFAASATPDLAAIVSPDLQLSLAGERMKVRGEVEVVRARINLERLESATRPSSDVVIVDAEQEAAAGTELDSEIGVVLGEDVRLVGFGLKAKLAGRLTVRDRPGRATVARGGVEVSGEYKAYGQDLQITRGQLSYASTPLDNPALDLRAQREVDDITVGVQVRGTALAPQLTLWSEPALDQAEQLSYLVLGRPLRSASQADGSQLTQAAAAFGGNLLAQRLGARMGLDEVGVADSRALGGAALTVGKYLSPKLYVSYGVALFGTGQVVTFKYLLSRVWSVQIDSGSENRAALNYRLER